MDITHSPLSPGAIAESHKFAKIAVSALGFDDVPTAVHNLQRQGGY